MCVWLLWPECCCVAGVRLVVPPGRHLTMGRKTPTIRVCPLPRCTSPPFIPLAMRLNNSLTAVCLPFVIGEAFAFAFCLCSSMCGEFFFCRLPIYGNCAIFSMRVGVFGLLYLFCFVFFFATTSVGLSGSSRGLACAHFYFIIFAGQPEAKSLKNTLCSGNISFDSEHQYELIKSQFLLWYFVHFSQLI